MTEPCPQFSEGVLSDYTDGELTRVNAWRVRRHLQACPACAGVVAEMTALSRSARSLYGSAPVAARGTSGRRRLPVRPLLAGAAALIAASVWFAPEMPGRPRVALADVENAMRQVKTVHWTATGQHYFRGKLRETTRVESWVRLDSPMIATRMTVCVTDRSGKQVVTVRRSIIDAHGTQWTASQGDSGQSSYEKIDATRLPIRQRIARLLFPQRGNLALGTWTQKTTPFNGTKALVFHRRMEFPASGVRYEQTAWADVKTRRLLRYQETHTRGTRAKDKTLPADDTQIFVATDYRYNEALPPDVFEIKPSPGSAATSARDMPRRTSLKSPVRSRVSREMVMGVSGSLVNSAAPSSPP